MSPFKFLGNIEKQNKIHYLFSHINHFNIFIKSFLLHIYSFYIVEIPPLCNVSSLLFNIITRVLAFVFIFNECENKENHLRQDSAFQEVLVVLIIWCPGVIKMFLIECREMQGCLRYDPKASMRLHLIGSLCKLLQA